VPGRDETARALPAGGPAPCADAACLREAGVRLGVDHWLRASCEMEASTYRFHLEMLDAKTGAVAAARDDKCEICTEAEAIEMINNGASTLKASLGQPTAAAPPSAAVPAPTAPAAGPVAPGADLTAARAPADEQPSTFRRALPWIAIGVGTVAATTAGFFLLQNGKGRDCAAVCQSVVDNKPWGIPVLVAGGALAITGAVLLVLDAKADSSDVANATRQSGSVRAAATERGDWAPRVAGIGLGPGGLTLTGTY
jgi:hypothetical protein